MFGEEIGMSENKNSQQERGESPVARAMGEKVDRVVVISSVSFVVTFLTLAVVALQFQDSWIAQKFLTGIGLIGGALLLLAVTMIVQSLIERWMARGKGDDRDESNSK